MQGALGPKDAFGRDLAPRGWDRPSWNAALSAAEEAVLHSDMEEGAVLRTLMLIRTLRAPTDIPG